MEECNETPIKLSEERPNILVAYASGTRAIGYMGGLPWGRRLHGDMLYVKRLRESEKNVALIMGKKTYEGIRKGVLAGNTIIVVSRTLSTNEDLVVARNVDDAILEAKKRGCFAILFGGSQIYRDGLKHPCKLFCTVVDDSKSKFEADTFFPSCDAKLINVTRMVWDSVPGVCSDERALLGDKIVESQIEYSFFVGENYLSR